MIGVAIVLVLMVFGIGGLAIYFEHVQKMAKIKAESGGGGELTDTLESIRREIAELRDTTTRYDMSFDSALQRLEGRVGNLEQASRQIPASPETHQIRASQ